MGYEFMQPLMIVIIVVAITMMVVGMLKGILPNRGRAREQAQDALQKLLKDLKASAKANRERTVKSIRMEGDRSVYRDTVYHCGGVLAHLSCYVVLWKKWKFGFWRVGLVPPQICSDLNATTISIKGRGWQRWNGLVWVAILTQQDRVHLNEYEKIWSDFLTYATLRQAGIEFHDIFTQAVYEAAEGRRYQDFVARTEKLPTILEPDNEKTVVREESV